MQNLFRIRDHHCFTKQCAALGAADVKGITKLCQILKAHIVLRACERIGKSRTINIQTNPEPVTDLSESLQFRFRIKSSILRRMGQIDHSRHHHMFMICVIIVIFQISFHVTCRDLSVLMRNCKDLMSVRLDRPRLMNTDMPRLGSNDSLIGSQQGVDHDGIGLCSSCQKFHSSAFASAGFSDPVPGGFGELVHPVSRCFHHIGLYHSLQNVRMRSFCIITGKAEFFIHVHHNLPG